jgi:hypothetical protein
MEEAMTPDQRAHLLGLAERVRTEEPTIGLAAALFDVGIPVECLTSRDAAAEAMPEELFVSIEQIRAAEWSVVVYRSVIGPEFDVVAQSFAPTEPRARCAAALLAMAEGAGT